MFGQIAALNFCVMRLRLAHFHYFSRNLQEHVTCRPITGRIVQFCYVAIRQLFSSGNAAADDAENLSKVASLFCVFEREIVDFWSFFVTNHF